MKNFHLPERPLACRAGAGDRPPGGAARPQSQPFLLHPVPGLLERHARHRTSHAALIAEILSLLAGRTPAPPRAAPRLEPLSGSKLRVLRYLPTNLSAPEIAGELHVSRNTVKAHMRNMYAKLGAHRRAEAVACARDLGLLAPSVHHLSLWPASLAGWVWCSPAGWRW